MNDLPKEQIFLEYVLKTIVSNVEDVKIERRIDEMGVFYTVDIAQDDISKIIGKNGQTIKAIRLLLKIVGYASNVRANLKINTEDKK